jgi:peptidoglycan/xylan/chitin deacetylase (PgdA/CDA1 family)
MLKRKIRRALVGALEMSGVLPEIRRHGTYDRGVILTYHSISEPTEENERYRSADIAISPAVFELQMRFLLKHYSVVPLGALVDSLLTGRAFPPRGVAITFDDGYRDNFTTALPILTRLGIPATVFVTTDAIGDGWAFWVSRLRAILHDAPQSSLTVEGIGEIDLSAPSIRRREIKRVTRLLKSLGRMERKGALDRLLEASGLPTPLPESTTWMMTWDEVRAMANAGIEIGAHTRSHPILTTLSDLEVIDEVTVSRDRVQTEIGGPVRHFAFPNGAAGVNFDDRVSDLVRRSGYSSASTSVRGAIRAESHPFQIPRLSISERHKLDGLAFDLERYRLFSSKTGASIPRRQGDGAAQPTVSRP